MKSPLQTRLINQVSWLIPTLEPNCILKLINPYRPLAMYLGRGIGRIRLC